MFVQNANEGGHGVLHEHPVGVLHRHPVHNHDQVPTDVLGQGVLWRLKRG